MLVISVRKKAGSMTETRAGWSSPRRQSESASKNSNLMSNRVGEKLLAPALETPYGAHPGRLRRDVMDAMLTMLPDDLEK